MNRYPKILLAGLLIMTAAAAAQGQITADVTVNMPLPTGNFADAADPGFGAGADVFLGLPLLPIKLGGHVGYERFSEKNNAGGNTTMIEIAPSLRYQLGLPFDLVSVWSQFGIGAYRWENDIDKGTDFGVSVGIGASARVLPTLNIMVMPLYHIVFSENDNTYLSLNAGIKF